MLKDYINEALDVKDLNIFKTYKNDTWLKDWKKYIDELREVVVLEFEDTEEDIENVDLDKDVYDKSSIYESKIEDTNLENGNGFIVYLSGFKEYIVFYKYMDYVLIVIKDDEYLISKDSLVHFIIMLISENDRLKGVKHE